jgi:hypothetical protein
MKNSTTTMNAENVVTMLLNSLEEGTKKGIAMLWDAGTSVLVEHWVLIGGIFVGRSLWQISVNALGLGWTIVIGVVLFVFSSLVLHSFQEGE